jgi:hypothetical protein
MGEAEFDSAGERTETHPPIPLFYSAQNFFDLNLRLGVRSFMLLRPK